MEELKGEGDGQHSSGGIFIMCSSTRQDFDQRSIGRGLKPEKNFLIEPALMRLLKLLEFMLKGGLEEVHPDHL